MSRRRSWKSVPLLWNTKWSSRTGGSGGAAWSRRSAHAAASAPGRAGRAGCKRRGVAGRSRVPAVLLCDDSVCRHTATWCLAEALRSGVGEESSARTNRRDRDGHVPAPCGRRRTAPSDVDPVVFHRHFSPRCTVTASLQPAMTMPFLIVDIIVVRLIGGDQLVSIGLSGAGNHIPRSACATAVGLIVRCSRRSLTGLVPSAAWLVLVDLRTAVRRLFSVSLKNCFTRPGQCLDLLRCLAREICGDFRHGSLGQPRERLATG